MNSANNDVATARKTPSATFMLDKGLVVNGDLTPSSRTLSVAASATHGVMLIVCFTNHQTTTPINKARKTNVMLNYCPFVLTLTYECPNRT